ncbi:MAG: YbjN domain-containing protein, partial [Bacteroidota bacterium]
VITELGADAEKCRGNTPGQWVYKDKTAIVYVDAWYIESEKRSYFQAMTPVMRLPTEDKHAEFFKELLELNDKMFDVAFTLFNGFAWIKNIRETEGLDRSEVMATMTRVANYKARYDVRLKEKYGEAALPPAGAPGAASDLPAAPHAPGKA